MTRIILIPGSLRAGSVNVAVLRTAAELAPEEVEAPLYEDLATLPHFSPDDDPDGGPVDPAVQAMREAVRGADALLFCTPEYAGTLPGSFKNLLEWTVGDASTYRKPVAWINVSSEASPTGGADAHESLRKVLGYVDAHIVEAAVARVPVPRAVIEGGVVADEGLRARIAAAVAALAEAA